MHKQTRCVHCGSNHDEHTRNINTPIFTSSAYDDLDRQDIPYPR